MNDNIIRGKFGDTVTVADLLEMVRKYEDTVEEAIVILKLDEDTYAPGCTSGIHLSDLATAALLLQRESMVLMDIGDEE